MLGPLFGAHSHSDRASSLREGLRTMTIANYFRSRDIGVQYGVPSLHADVQWLLSTFHTLTDPELVALHLDTAKEDRDVWQVATSKEIVAARRVMTRAGWVWPAGRKGFRRLWSVDSEDM
jgi:hypothetical protein